MADRLREAFAEASRKILGSDIALFKNMKKWKNSDCRDLVLLNGPEFGTMNQVVIATIIAQEGIYIRRLPSSATVGDYVVGWKGNRKGMELKGSREDTNGRYHWNWLDPAKYDPYIAMLVGISPYGSVSIFTCPFAVACKYTDGDSHGPMAFKATNMPRWLYEFGDGSLDVALDQLRHLIENDCGCMPGNFQKTLTLWGDDL